MTLREAAQQALEALETCGEDEWYTHDDYGMVQTYDEEKVHEAITALRAALADQRKPLSVDEIKALHKKVWSYCDMTTPDYDFARAIEAAHGIGDSNGS